MKLSIITINYNNSAGLQHTLQSVSRQTYADYEYILIDGASTDGSVEVIHQNSHLFTSWVSENDHGIYNAMNKGLQHATGEYVLFLNSGDALHDEHTLERAIHVMQGADVCCFDADFIYPNGMHERHTYPDVLTFEFLYQSSFCHQSLLYKTERLKAIGGYDEQYRIIGDWVCNVRLLIIENATYEHHNLCLADYNMEGISWSTDGRQLDAQEREFFLHQHFSKRILADYQHWTQEQQPDYRYLKNIHSLFLKSIVSTILHGIYKIDKRICQ